MKFANIIARIAAVLFCTFGFAAAGSGLSVPYGLAVDAAGNLWVANFQGNNGLGSISMYTNGKQNTNATITNGIVGPYAIAIDGMGNI